MPMTDTRFWARGGGEPRRQRMGGEQKKTGRAAKKERRVEGLVFREGRGGKREEGRGERGEWRGERGEGLQRV